MSFRADLHCHSTCSDGTITPIDLIYLAKKMGLSGLSITDHDTIACYVPELFQIASEVGIRLKTGAEFSTGHQGVGIHVLAYSFPPASPLLVSFCQEHQQRRHDRNSEILELLKKHGMPIAEEDLLAYGTIGRPHIAEQMLARGYVKTFREAFDRYLGDNKSCYAPGKLFTIEETLEIIFRSGGKSFLAHPALIREKKILKDLLEYPFDGIEVYYGTLSDHEKEKWAKIAKEHDLLVSGGSDFHGGMTPEVPLGISWVDEETFELI